MFIMNENEKGRCHICFQEPEVALLNFEPYKDLVQNITQIKSDVSLILNQICESCASDVVAIDCFRTKFVEASQNWKKILKNQSRPAVPKNCCKECGNTCETTSIDLQTWKRVCSSCSIEKSTPTEVLNEEDIKQEFSYEIIDEEMAPDLISSAEENYFSFNLEEESWHEDGPINDRLKGDDFEWPLHDDMDEKIQNETTKKIVKKGRPKKRKPKGEPLMKCVKCNHSSFTLSDWEIHNEVGHEGSCKFCDYKNKSYLRQHVLLNHLPHLWPYLCDYCGTKFAQKAAFQFHWGNHDMEKYVYKCHFCSIGFVRKWRLQDHILKRHLRIKRFKCKYCPKSYLDSTDRDRHECIHTNKWPVRCKICDKGFPRKREMIKHMATHE